VIKGERDLLNRIDHVLTHQYRWCVCPADLEQFDDSLERTLRGLKRRRKIDETGKAP
jgi:hypothetical protein